MTKGELIAKQQLEQLELEELRKQISVNENLVSLIRHKFIGIGQPLNDNNLKMDRRQIGWCFEVLGLVEQIEI